MKTQLIVAAILWLAASNTVWSTEEEHNKNEIDFSIKTSACQSFSLRPHSLVDSAAVSYFYLAETLAGRIGDGLPPPSCR